MAQSFTTENLRDLFSYPFKDPKWVSKLVIGGLISLFTFLIIPVFFLYGYFARILRNAIKGDEPSLPEWDEWEKMFTDGGKLFLAVFIYMLPMAIIMIIAYVFIFAGSFSTEFAEYARDPDSLLWPITYLLGSFGGTFLFGIAMLIALITGAFTPVIMGHVVAKDDFMAAFQVGEWWQIFRANTSGFLISYLILLAALFLANVAMQLLGMTIILCCVTPFLSLGLTFYIMTVGNVLFGQAYRIGVQNLESSGTSLSI